MAYGSSASRTKGQQVPTNASAFIDVLIELVWGTLTSVKLALFLILSIAAAAFVGAVIMQAPPPALANEAQYDIWFEQAREKYGVWAGLFDRLQFFRVFSSIWFRLLLVVLSANILVCTADRTPRLLALVRRKPTVQVSDQMFQRAPLRSAIPVSDEHRGDADAALVSALKRRRFHVERIEDGDTVHLVAEKNKYARLGTLLHHAGLIVVLLGAVWGARGGFHESQFIIAEGDTRAVGHDTGLSIRLDSFVDEYYAGGGGVPKDYRSNIAVLKDGEEVRTGTVRVNEPVVYNGVRVHQSFYGPAIDLLVIDPESGPLFNEPVPLAWSAEDRPAGSFTLPQFGVEIFVIAPSTLFIDPVIRPGEVRLEIYQMGGSAPVAMQNIAQGEITGIGGLQFIFMRESRFTGLQVVQDPGLPFVWIGSAIVVLGAMAVLNFPHRRLWARVQHGADGTTVSLAAPKERGLPFDLEFKRIDRSLRDRLGAGDRAAFESGS